MATPFDTDFDNGDFIEVDHVKQFAQPINNLESRIINTSAPLTGGCLRRSKSEPLAGVIVIHPWRFWWVGF